MAQGQQRRLTRNAAIAAALAAVLAPLTGGGSIAAFFTTFATTYALGSYAARQAAKGMGEENIERKVMLRTATAPHRIVLGQAFCSGVLVYGTVTGSAKEYLHLVIALTGHRIHGMPDIWLGDVRLPDPDGSGNITSGPFAGLVRVKRYLGLDSQTADADLVSESGGQWTADHRGNGVGYLYIRLTWSEDKFPNGIPDIRALCLGALVYDPRVGLTRVTDNPALLERHYLLAPYGIGCTTGELDDGTYADAANVSDQWIDTGIDTVSVTADSASNILTTSTVDSRLSTGDRIVLGGTAAPGGTTLGATYYLIRRGPQELQLASNYQNAIEFVAIDLTSAGTAVTLTDVHQKRYVARGSFTLDALPSQIEEQLRLTMAGHHVWSAGRWRCFAGAHLTPTRTIGPADLRGGVVWHGKRGRHDVTNTIRGQFVDPTQGWTMVDYPAITDPTYVAEDGGEPVAREIEQPWCDNAFRAQRIAKILLRRGRAGTVTVACKLKALRLATATTVNVDIPQLMPAAVYRISSLKLSGEDGGIGVDLSLEQADASQYDWAAEDGTAPTVTTPVVLPDALTVGAPTGLTLDSGNAELLKGTDGSIVSRIRVGWFHAQEPNPLLYEIEYKRAADTAWTRTTVARSENSTYIAPVQDGVTYDVRVRTLSALGVRSAWLTGTETVIGKTGAPTAPTTISVLPASGGYDLAWTASPDADYSHTEVWESATNDRSTATLHVEVAGNRYPRTGITGGSVRYYWVRDVDTSGNPSTFCPPGATSGAGAIAGASSIPRVASIPTTVYQGDIVYCNADENLYIWNLSVYEQAEPLVAAARVVAASLSAISANLGSITAGSIDIAGLFQVSSAGAVLIRSATSGARLEIRNNSVRVYDGAGTLRVELGELT